MFWQASPAYPSPPLKSLYLCYSTLFNVHFLIANRRDNLHCTSVDFLERVLRKINKIQSGWRLLRIFCFDSGCSFQ